MKLLPLVLFNMLNFFVFQVKTRKRKADDPLCPVCNQRISQDIVAHVDICLKRSEGRTNGTVTDDEDDDSDNSVDVEAESFEEYEWAGQTRIRASSLLEGGYRATGIGTTIINNNKTNNDNGDNDANNDDDDDDEDLNVDGDDTQVLYGPPQYTERDVILPLISTNNKKETERLLYLRNLATGQNLNDTPPGPTKIDDNSVVEMHYSHTNVGENVNNIDDNNDIDDVNGKPSTSWTNDNIKITTNGDAGQKQIIESLKKKIREYELQIRNKSKCLICIDEFRIPVVSICCWHVHCEECWLRTLGARKLCPQCNMITSPSDLRRIYM